MTNNRKDSGKDTPGWYWDEESKNYMRGHPTPPAQGGDICEDCGKEYHEVYSVPNGLWSQIAPDKASLGEHFEHQFGGLLCSSCATVRARELGLRISFIEAGSQPTTAQ